MGTFLLSRTRADALYKTETTQNRERPLLSWRVLRWAVIPTILLLLLTTIACTVIWINQDSSKEIKNHEDSSSEEKISFGLGARTSHTKLPDQTIDGENLVPNVLNDLEEIKKEEEQSVTEGSFDNSTDISLGEEVSFIDRLISSFQVNRPIQLDTAASQGIQGPQQQRLNVKQFTSLGETGYVRRVPNGHKYGEYQVSFPSLTKYFGVSTTALPVSPTLPSLQPKGALKSTVPPLNQNETSNCHSPQLPMCRGVIPWDLTSVPSLPGITTLESLREAMPYFELILDSGCSQRARQFLCSLLEPECQPTGATVTPPCRHTCKAVAEECNDFIINILDLSQVFKCDNYPDSDDACINFAKGNQCLSKEISCGEDDICIPKRWKCNGVSDCKNGMDEVNCTICNKYQFSCESRDSCIPSEWRCDGNADCEDGSDETNCEREEEMVMHSHASPCPSGELRCVDGRCITLQQICDGNKDCSDGADEANCRIQYS